ncbi:MAG: hypothetical protein NVSMB67_07820 [Flavisolibacter sp.]
MLILMPGLISIVLVIRYTGMKIQYKLIVICAVFLTSLLPFYAPLGAQKLKVVKKQRLYWQEVRNDSLQRMVELKTEVPSLVYDLRYAAAGNFTHKKLYKSGTKTFLRIRAVHALAQIQKALSALGYGLKIFDAYRPYKVTVAMWKQVRDPRYVADPSKGSGHNRGIAVDLTLIDLKNGKELNMGTGFDNFTDSAHQDFNLLPLIILQNRNLLRKTMLEYGFMALPTEWWHYSWQDNHLYSILGLSFRQLSKKIY